MGLLDWLSRNDPSDATELKLGERRPVTNSPKRGAVQREFGENDWRTSRSECDEAVNKVRRKWRPQRD